MCGGSVSESVSNEERQRQSDRQSDVEPRGKEKSEENAGNKTDKWTGRCDVLSISFRQGAKQSSRAAYC